MPATIIPARARSAACRRRRARVRVGRRAAVCRRRSPISSSRTPLRSAKSPPDRRRARGAIAWNVALCSASSRCITASLRASPVRALVARVVPAAARAIVLRLDRKPAVHRASAALWQPVPGVAWQVDGAVALGAAASLQVAGIWLTLRSAAHHRRLRTGRRPAADPSPTPGSPSRCEFKTRRTVRVGAPPDLSRAGS